MFEQFYQHELHKPYDQYINACIKNALFYCAEPILNELAVTTDEARFNELQIELTRAYQFVEYDLSIYFKEMHDKHLQGH